ncbi:MAG: gamma-glutamyltransferase, partial [Pseudomonadota bacterium]
MRTKITGLMLAVAIAAGAQGQSSNPFGLPTADNPQPAARIAAAPGSRAQGWLGQGRSEILARHGVVATSDPLASEAGLEILRKGGNAIDAIVAAAAVLDVTSQNDTGIAGDLFALVWSAKDQKLFALNSAGWAPQGWTREFFNEELNVDEMPYWGVNAATVPGAISGYDALLTRFGTMGFKETFERAARLAEEGWGLGERRHRDLSRARDRLREDADSAATFLEDGEVPPLYSIIRNPDLAKALRLIQEEGRDAFYKGDIARAIVAKIRAGGGVMTREDLAE